MWLDVCDGGGSMGIAVVGFTLDIFARKQEKKEKILIFLTEKVAFYTERNKPIIFVYSISNCFMTYNRID